MHAMAPYHGSHGRQTEMFDPFSLYFWDPFHHQDFPSPPTLMTPPPLMLPNIEPSIRSRIEYKDTPEAHHFKAELPGVKKEDIKVDVEDGKILHIAAKRKHEKEEKKDKYHHVVRGYGEFVTKFKLPSNVKPRHIRSYLENGALTVVVPKEKVDKLGHGHYY